MIFFRNLSRFIILLDLFSTNIYLKWLSSFYGKSQLTFGLCVRHKNKKNCKLQHYSTNKRHRLKYFLVVIAILKVKPSTAVFTCPVCEGDVCLERGYAFICIHCRTHPLRQSFLARDSFPGLITSMDNHKH